MIPADIKTYNSHQAQDWRAICDRLADDIAQALPEAKGKVWHGGPVWFIEDNPVVGYWVRKASVQLLFWSGQSFGEPGLRPEGKFKAAEAHYGSAEAIGSTDLARWLAKARNIQWDYNNIVRRKGVLEWLKQPL